MASKTPTSQELYAPTRELLMSLVSVNPNDLINTLMGNEADRNPRLPAAPADPRASLDIINPPSPEVQRDYENQVAIAALTDSLGQSQAFHDKPSKVAVQSPSISAANRVNTGARLRGSNTIATIDSNGRTVITGGKGITTGYETGYEQDPNYGKVVGVMSTAAKLASAPTPSDTLASMMNDVAKEEDPDARLGKLFQVKSSYEAQIASMKAAAYQAAELEMGVPGLKTSLEASIEADRADPLWSKYQTDSAVTKGARAQYQSALASATTLADKHFLSNPEVGKLKGLIEPFLDMQQKRYAKYATRGDDVKDMTDLLGDKPKRLAEASFVGTQDPAAAAAKNMNNKEFYEAAVTMQSPERLIPLALRTDNMFAGKALALEQATALAGGTKANPALFNKKFSEAEKEINFIKELTYNDDLLMKTYETTIGKKPTMPLMDPLADKKEATAMRGALKEQMALEIVKEAKRKEFLTSTASWDNFHRFTDPDSLGSKLYQKALEGTGSPEGVTLATLASSVAKFPPEQMPAMEVELKKIVREALKTSAGGIYGNWASASDANSLVDGYLRGAISSKSQNNLLGFLDKVKAQVIDPAQQEFAALAAYPGALSSSIMTSESVGEILPNARTRSLGAAEWLLGKENK